MKKSNTVLLTTIFPASERFLDDFFRSLEKQTSKDFDLLIMNDGVRKFSVYTERYSKLNIIEKLVFDTPVKNREVGINKAIELKYKNIVFGDSDDYFSENRMQETVNALVKHDIVFNDLTIVNKEENMKGFFLNSLKGINTIQEDIIEYNVFGLSNMAIRANVVIDKVEFDNDIIAVDWFFISSLLLKRKFKIKFLYNVQTYYRQYDNNIIGMSSIFTNHKLELGLRVKEKHYIALSHYCKNNRLIKFVNIIQNKLTDIGMLKKELKNPLFKKKYLNVVNANFDSIFTGWWSEIISIEKYYEYKNK